MVTSATVWARRFSVEVSGYSVNYVIDQCEYFAALNLWIPY